MFFFGIFGIDSKSKEIKDFNNVKCKACGRLGSYKLYKNYSHFHFFFIPIFKWGYKYKIVSRCCKSVFTISKEKGKRLEDEIDTDIYDSDLHFEYSEQSYCNQTCSNCGKESDGIYHFCPYCGNRL